MSSLNTINGTLEDASGSPQKSVQVIFTPLGTPQFAGPLITNGPPVTVTSDAATGQFTLALEPGNYGVQVMVNPVTAFDIAVPAGAGHAYNIGDLVTSAVVPLPGFVFGCVPIAGTADPSGQVAAAPGTTYVNTAANSFWVKLTGTDASGWQKFVQL
jgi:hypothetical protein